MVSFGEKAKIKKGRSMLLQLYMVCVKKFEQIFRKKFSGDI